jgi:hypothetical protein
MHFAITRGQIVVFFCSNPAGRGMDEKTERVVPVSVAAFAKGLKYAAALDQVLTGRLKGVRRGGRWYVYESELPAERDEDGE